MKEKHITKMDLVVYLLMRTDLPSMNPGKAMAQAYHAGNQIVKHVRTISPEGEFVTEYFRQGDRGMASDFSTTICLGVTLADMQDILNQVEVLPKRYVTGRVHDPSYPFWVDSEIATLLDCAIHNAKVSRVGTVWNADARGTQFDVKTTPFYMGDLTNEKIIRDDKVLFTREEVTCAWVLCDKNDSDIKFIFDRYSLHP